MHVVYRSHVVSLQCEMRSAGRTSQLTPPRTPHLSPTSTSTHTPLLFASPLVACSRPVAPQVIDLEVHRQAATPQKEHLPAGEHVGGPQAQTQAAQHPARQRRIGSRFPEAPHKIYEPWRESLLASNSHLLFPCCALHLLCTLGLGRLLGLPTLCYVGLQGQVIHKYCTSTHLHCMCSCCCVAASLLLSSQP